MNSGHDLGGRHGLGTIAPEAEDQEPVFHAEWERRSFCSNLGNWYVREMEYR